MLKDITTQDNRIKYLESIADKISIMENITNHIENMESRMEVAEKKINLLRRPHRLIAEITKKGLR